MHGFMLKLNQISFAQTATDKIAKLKLATKAEIYSSAYTEANSKLKPFVYISAGPEKPLNMNLHYLPCQKAGYFLGCIALSIPSIASFMSTVQ